MKRWKNIFLGLALLAGASIALFAWSRDRRTDPVLSGRRMSHWLRVLDSQASGASASEEALRILLASTQHAALQAQILDRIEHQFSSPSLAWYQFYTQVGPGMRRHLPVPQFGRIGSQTLSLLSGISTNASPRQKAALDTVIRFGPFLQSLEVAYDVALSESTQSSAEALMLARRELTSPDPVRRLSLCAALRAKRGLDGWRGHTELLSGLRLDLGRLVFADPVSEVSVAARKALDHLNSELGTTKEALQSQPQSAGGGAGQAEIPADAIR